MLRCILFISILFLITTNAHSEASPCSQHQCIAVVDAGSTGSRVHIFAYDSDKSSTPDNITEVWSKKIKPGFASLETNQSTIDAYLTILFSETPIQNIPVYFYATGGMRLVPQSRQITYYHNLKNWFKMHTEWPLADAKTITGNEEALYDWLAVNYHLGTLKSVNKKAVGVLDIGGASTQIAFPLKDNQNIQGMLELDLYGQHVRLFIHSFLGLGQNEMTHQLLSSPSCFSMNYPLPNGTTGQGNALECKQELVPLINGVHKANSLIQPVLNQSPVSKWYAIGGIANLAESKPFQFSSDHLTNQDFLQQANNLACQQSWDEMRMHDPNNEYLDGYCLMPAYYYALMVDGYGFSPNQEINYIPTAQNLDWTLGVVLHQIK